MLRRGVTVVELLVLFIVIVVLILIVILLPEIGGRSSNCLTRSQANMRQLAVAHQTYAADNNDRQFTMIDDAIASYGNDANSAIAAFQAQGNTIPWCELGHDASGREWILGPPTVANLPYNWDVNFGSFRLINCTAFNQYIGGRWFDPVFYAPKDTTVCERVEPFFEGSESFVDPATLGGIAYSSYITSPAALFDPQVFSKDGWVDPWTMDTGLACPNVSDALFPELKTQMIEHHWLHNARRDCNPAFVGGFAGCQPYFFNHSQDSQPVTLFYDGHIQSVSVKNAEQDSDVNHRSAGYALWRPDTPNGSDGYYMPQGYDHTNTSFHIFTTDGIRGRDILK